MLDFSDQHVIVTGGTRGIGRALTQAFLARGAHVTATFSTNPEAGEALRREVDAGDRLALARFDVSDHEAVKRFFEALGHPLHVLVNNAGIRKDAIVGMMKAEDWKRVLEVNLDGTFYMSKYAVQAMSRPKYGRIVNVTSPSADLGLAGQANYAASKAGQIAFTKTLAREVAKRRITVNCVQPGFVDTELLSDLSAETKKTYEDSVPMGRFATTEEIATAVLYLASKEASYVTGTVLRVAGGL
jgi:3-oxoacyl-[acyl-carrier protein] reductase